jgi:hypothetical protein
MLKQGIPQQPGTRQIGRLIAFPPSYLQNQIHFFSKIILYCNSRTFLTGHSTHFQVGGDNPKIEGGILQNKAVFYFHFDIFIFENKVAGGKCN